MNAATRVNFRGKGDKISCKEERRRQKKCNDGDSESSLDPIAVIPTRSKNDTMVMNNLHSSYGALNNSLNNLSLSAFQSCSSGLNLSTGEFKSPAPCFSSSPCKPPHKVTSAGEATTSPWGVKLRKTTTQPVAQSPVKTSALHNYNLMEEFATPRQWESPVKTSPHKSHSTQRPTIHLPVLEGEDDASSETSTASQRCERLSRKGKKKEKRVVDAKREKNESSLGEGEKEECKKKKASKLKKKVKEDEDRVSQQAKRDRLEQERQNQEAILQKRAEQAAKRKAERSLCKQMEAKRCSEEEARKTRLEAEESKMRQEERVRLERKEKLRRQHDSKMRKQYRTQIESLQHHLDAIRKATDAEIAAINSEHANKKLDLKQRAIQRHQKNLKRPTKEDATVGDGKDIIALLRKENATIRDRNETMFAEIQKLQINNQRLERSNAESEHCMGQLQFHDEACVAEHAKLTRIEMQYRNAVQDHSDHLELHSQYAATESKISKSYDKTLTKIVSMMDKKCREQALLKEVREIVDFMHNNETSEVLSKEY